MKGLRARDAALRSKAITLTISSRPLLELYYDAPEQWQELVRHDMSQDFGWDKGAESYMALYHKALGDKA